MAAITRDALLARRAQLADEEKLAWANLNAVLGAQQDIDYWIAHLAEPGDWREGMSPALRAIPDEASG